MFRKQGRDNFSPLPKGTGQFPPTPKGTGQFPPAPKGTGQFNFPPLQKGRDNFPPAPKGTGQFPLAPKGTYEKFLGRKNFLETGDWRRENGTKKMFWATKKGRSVPFFFAGRGTKYLGRDRDGDGNDEIGRFETKKGRFWVDAKRTQNHGPNPNPNINSFLRDTKPYHTMRALSWVIVIHLTTIWDSV